MNGLLKTTVIDKKNNKQETFANGSGLTVRTTQYASASEPINTYFAYNPINQLIEVTDAMGRKTWGNLIARSGKSEGLKKW